MTFFIARLLRRAMSRKQTTYSALDETFSSSISASEAYSTEDPSWRPSYLRRRVYALFVAVFFLLVVAVEVLLFISDGKCGLATSVAGLHYLWTYGPTAVLTLVASFWVRVDYQMKSTAPWSRMMKGFTLAQHSVLLDYISSSQLSSIYSATRNKDYSVVASSLVSLILRIITVISTSLIILSPIQISNKLIEVTLTTQFVNKLDPLEANKDLIYQALLGNVIHNLSLPEGVTNDSAYQIVEAESYNVSHFTTTIDAFYGDLNCESAVASNAGASAAGWNLKLRSNNFDLNVACEPATNITDFHSICTAIQPCNLSSNTLCFGLVVSTTKMLNPAPNNGGQDYGSFALLLENGFICNASHNIRPTNLIRNGNETSLSSIPDAPSLQLSSLNNSDILQRYGIPVFQLEPAQVVLVSGVPVHLDSYTQLLYYISSKTQSGSSFPSSLESLYSDDSIIQLARAQYQQYAAVFARLSVMEVSSLPSTATALATVSEDRLLVQKIPTQIMSALLLISAILTGVIWIMHRKLSLPQSPNTITGISTILAHNPLTALTGLGNAPAEVLKTVVGYWKYNVSLGNDSPSILSADPLTSIDHQFPLNKKPTKKFRVFSLSTTTRLLALILITSLLATLEITLRKSRNEAGLGNVPIHDIELQLWTILPGILATVVGMYCGSMDFDTRTRTPFSRLAKGLTFDKNLDLDLLDRHTSQLVGAEIRTRSFDAMASTVALIITSFLTISSASLFFAATRPSQSTVQLQVDSSIYYPATPPALSRRFAKTYPGFETGTLVLLENVSYPAFTYEDLIFPGLKYENQTDPGVTLETTGPAVRIDFTECRLYDSSEIKTNITWRGDQGPLVEIEVLPEQGCFLQSFEGYLGSMFGIITAGCSRQVWAWGKWDNTSLDMANSSSITAFALGCNDTLQNVESRVVIDPQAMAIDTSKPPDANLSTATNLGSLQSLYGLTFEFGLPLFQEWTDHPSLDPFFQLVVESRYAIPVAYLGDPDRASVVADAICFHFKILFTQYLNANWRFTTEQIQSNDYNRLPGISEATLLNGTIHNPAGRNRIIQDPASTRVLQVILGATLICIATNWFLMRNNNILPRSPTTIANWIVLLADGNLNEFLPVNSARMPLEQLSQCFGQNVKLCYGFRVSPKTGERVLGIYVTK